MFGSFEFILTLGEALQRYDRKIISFVYIIGKFRFFLYGFGF